MKKGKGDRVIYSTNPKFNFEEEKEDEMYLLPNKQNLKIYPDRKNRAGKTVTIITGFIGSGERLKELEKELKSHCGCGGTSKDGDILIQGNFIQKISEYLKNQGYNIKISGV